MVDVARRDTLFAMQTVRKTLLFSDRAWTFAGFDAPDLHWTHKYSFSRRELEAALDSLGFDAVWLRAEKTQFTPNSATPIVEVRLLVHVGTLCPLSDEHKHIMQKQIHDHLRWK